MKDMGNPVQAPRDAFAEALIEIARDNEDIVVLDADLGSSTRALYFAEAYPGRFFQMGVAEQNMMGVAAGMALMGKVPFVSTFAVFSSRRACDQVAISVAHCRANVKILGAYTGIVSGNNGATHQAVEDVGIMRSLPGMVVIDPADDVEMRQVVREIVEYDGPVYLRVTRDAWPRVVPEGYEFSIGEAVQLRQGGDVSLVGSGMMSSQCVLAADLLAASGLEAQVLHIPTIKPIDTDAVVEAAQSTGAIVTAENHSVYGGLGSAVCEVTAEYAPARVRRIGLRDCYGECGGNEELLSKYEMSPRHIADAALTLVRENRDEPVPA
jgi:transketolase